MRMEIIPTQELNMSLISILVLVSCFAAAFGQQCSCGIENTDSRIIGGVRVADGKYPWMAFLLIKTSKGYSQCGGSIINNYYILTAAHCVYNAVSIQVGVGSNYDVSGNNLLEVAKFFHHASYNPSNTHNDIALIKLRQPLTMSKKVRPVCLPPASMGTSGSLTVAGWGLTESGKTSSVLLETTVEEYSWDKCNYDWGNGLIKSQFCAALIGKDSCGGDSGGPLTSRSRGKSYVVGLVSYGVTDCGSAKSAVYTKVTSFLDWIQQNTRDGTYCAN